MEWSILVIKKRGLVVGRPNLKRGLVGCPKARLGGVEHPTSKKARFGGAS